MIKDLFGFEEEQKENHWQEHYIDMPEYNNVKQDEPFITATFKFRNQEDFNNFNTLIKQHLYEGAKVFDGMQRKDKKSAWFPLGIKANKYRYQ
jgi:hypothetical protein